MSIMNPLPPQAYTKDTLVQAYAWLQLQSENIKELATTPDVLVSLYLKAKMQGDGALERPSIQNFKNELRNLAGMMGEFEVLDPHPGSPTTPASNGHGQTIRIRSQDLRASLETQKAEERPAPRYSPPPLPESPSKSASPSLPDFPSATGASSLDSRSLDMIQEVKIQFNLSSDSEAQRLLLSIGYNQIKGLLK